MFQGQAFPWGWEEGRKTPRFKRRKGGNAGKSELNRFRSCKTSQSCWHVNVHSDSPRRKQEMGHLPSRLDPEEVIGSHVPSCRISISLNDSPGQSSEPLVSIAVSALVCSCSAGRRAHVVLEVQHTAVHSGRCTYNRAFWRKPEKAFSGCTQTRPHPCHTYLSSDCLGLGRLGDDHPSTQLSAPEDCRDTGSPLVYLISRYLQCATRWRPPLGISSAFQAGRTREGKKWRKKVLVSYVCPLS